VNNFAHIQRGRVFHKVTYYTVTLEGAKTDLFTNFINTNTNEQTEDDIDTIIAWLQKLGNTIGAQERYFRFEAYAGGEASALPPPPQFLETSINHRLYCMRISDTAVVLFSGGLKTADTAQKCPNVRPHFLLANRLSKAIQRLIIEKEIQINHETNDLGLDKPLEFEY
jgi:hypothetical protein